MNIDRTITVGIKQSKVVEGKLRITLLIDLSSISKESSGEVEIPILPETKRRSPYAYTLLPDYIATEYQNGETLQSLAIKHQTAVETIRQKLSSLSVKIRLPGIKKGQRNNAVSKITDKQLAWILEQDLQNVEHAEIARHVNLTRERVRQICMEAGHEARRKRMTKVVEYKEELRARILNREQKIKQTSEMWKNGASFAEIAIFYGVCDPKRGPNLISQLRKKYPKLFPHRQPNHWTLKQKQHD